MGAKAPDVADAIGVERESYYRLERETFRLSLTQIESAATFIGVRPDQFWFHPPTPGATAGVDLNGLIADQTPETQAMIIKAVRGMVGK